MSSIRIGKTTASARKAGSAQCLCSVRDEEFGLDLTVAINCGEHENEGAALARFLSLAIAAIDSLTVRESHPNNDNWRLLPDEVAYWACRNDDEIQDWIFALEETGE